MGGVAVVLGAVAVCLGAAAWRLHALPADQAHRLLRALGAEHEAMWASVWGPLPVAAQVSPAVSQEALGWSLWPRPQIHLDGVRWAVERGVASDRLAQQLSSRCDASLSQLQNQLSGLQRTDHADEPPPHPLRPQVITKALLDAIKGYLFHDDAQVARLLVEQCGLGGGGLGGGRGRPGRGRRHLHDFT